MSLPVFLLLMAGVAALIGYTIWLIFQPPRRDANPFEEQARDMAEKVQAIGETISRINAAHKAAYDSVEARPRDADPRETYDGYVEHAPDPRLRYDFERLRKRFEETDHPPYVAVIAGLALREMETPGVDEHLRHKAIRLVFDHGGPEAVDYLAAGLEGRSEGVDRWIDSQGEDRVPAAAISRMEPRDASVAARLKRLAASSRIRGQELAIRHAEWVIGRFEPFDELEDTYVTAIELLRLCAPPYPPEFAVRVRDMVAGRSASPDWRSLRLQMDLILIENDRHPEPAAAIARMESALNDPDEGVVDTTGEVVADLVEQSLLDPGYRGRIRDGLDRAIMRFDPPPTGLLRLKSAIRPSATDND